MSGYRPIYKRIWKDPDFQELAPEDKLLFLYFCTNEATNESGIYPLTPKTTATETGIPLPTVAQRFANGLPTVDKPINNGSQTDGEGLTNGCIKNVYYDRENKLIFVKKLRKYNTGGRSDLVYKSIVSEYSQCQYSKLWDLFFEEYPEFCDLPNGSPTVGKPLSNPSPTHRYDNDNNNDIDKDNKRVVRGNENDIRREVMLKVKELRGYDTRNRGAEIHAINEMIKEGFGTDKIVKAFETMRTQPFFQDKYLSLTFVHKNIHEVLKNVKTKGIAGNRPSGAFDDAEL